jgi:hypothetical protein
MTICRICNERQARKGRRKCSGCERATGDTRAQELVVRERPDLVWTGLLIDDENNEVVLPDGSRRPLLAFSSGPGKYWYESDGHGRKCGGDAGKLMLRVMVEA